MIGDPRREGQGEGRGQGVGAGWGVDVGQEAVSVRSTAYRKKWWVGIEDLPLLDPGYICTHIYKWKGMIVIVFTRNSSDDYKGILLKSEVILKVFPLLPI